MTSRAENHKAEKRVSHLIRCAVYTRKSTDEGLNMDFNSLDAQREAAEAYIASQKSEGWTCLPERYDDGGFSGGNMDRPALKRLLFLTGQQAVVRTNIGCKRMYLEETQKDGAQLAGAFELRSGLTLERTTTRHPWIPPELVTPATGDTPPQDGGGLQLNQPEHEMQEE